MATATQAQQNGTKAETTFPLDSFKDAAPHLRRPFTPEAVKFKVQATWPKDNPTGGLIVSYIDARLVVERLNLIVPHLWCDDYEVLGKSLVCHLTVDGITRKDVGEGVVKGLFSDALKRAGVKFGIGVSLYAVPSITMKVGSGLEIKRGGQVVLTATGEADARRRYAAWLETYGVAAFGEPLSHGDVEGAQGDAEVEQEPVVRETGEVVSAETSAELREVAKGLTASQVKMALGSVGAQPPQPFTPETAFTTVPASKAAELAQKLASTERKS